MPEARRVFPFCASALAFALVAAPDEARAADGYHAFSVGMSLSFSLGARPSFGFGGELRYTYYVDYLPLGYQMFGGFAQATYLRSGAGRFSFGGHGGVASESVVYAGDVEAGLTYRTDTPDGRTPGGLALHVGLMPVFSLVALEHGPSIRSAIGLSSDVKSELILGWDVRGPGPCLFIDCRALGGSGVRRVKD